MSNEVETVIGSDAFEKMRADILAAIESNRPNADITTRAVTSLDDIQLLAIANGMPARYAYNVYDVSRLTGYSERSIYRAIESGKLIAKAAADEDERGKKIQTKDLMTWLESL